MLFDNTNPSTAYWNPPKLASGSAKTRLALFGYNADGTQNTWGKISSWIPGANLMANISAQQVAKGAGLTDVASNVAADTDNRLQKLQTLLAAGKTVAGAVTANPELIQSGIQGVTQGVAGTLQTKDDDLRLNGSTMYQRFASGGKPKRPATSLAAARAGADFTANWIEARARAGRGGLEPADATLVSKITTPTVTNQDSVYRQAEAGPLQGLVQAPGAYNPSTEQAYLRPTSDKRDMAATAVGLSTAQLQDVAKERLPNEKYTGTDWRLNTPLLGNIGRKLGILDDPFRETYSRISDAVSETGKPIGSLGRDNSPRDPALIHQHLMQLRYNGGLKPDETVTPERFRNAVLNNSQSDSTLHSLRRVLTDAQIQDLLNTTASTARPVNDGTFRAADGGIIYPKHDKTTEDMIMLDKKALQEGRIEKTGEMRYNERIFDQHATLKMEELAKKGNATALGKFMLAELATHKDRMGGMAQYFAGGGKPTRPNPNRQAIIDEQRALAQAGLYRGPIDGIVGPKTRAARQAKLSATPTAPFVNNTTADPALVAQFNPLAAFVPAEVKPPMRDPTSYSMDPIKPRTTLIPPSGQSMLDTMKGKATPTQAQIASGMAAMGSGQSGDEKKTDWLGMGTDALRGITAAIGAAQPLPTRPVNPNLLQMQRELADKQNEGLSAGDRINLMRARATTQARDIQGIRDAVGGGGGGNAVLAAINQADARANAMGSSIEEADRSQRAVNKQNYMNDLQATQQGSDAIFAQQYDTALNNRNAFTQSLVANLQNMADRNQYNAANGPGSPMYNLMLEMVKRTGKSQAYADAPVKTLPVGS